MVEYIFCINANQNAKKKAKGKYDKYKTGNEKESIVKLVEEDTRWENPSPWTYLPDTVLVQIYEVLCDHDKAQMAKVCKDWARAFNSPTLWRERRYIFGSDPERTADKACQFLKRFGHHMRTLTIGFIKPSFRNVRRLVKAAERFFKKLTFYHNLRLEEFTLQYANMDRYWHYPIPRHQLISALCRFLRRLHHLTIINLPSARMNITEGCRVLQSLGRGKASETLNVMYVEDMFQQHFIPSRSKRYNLAMCKFLDLTYLYLNYNMINSEILGHMGNARPNFERLTLTLDTVIGRRVIPSEAWKQFRMKCITAKVSIFLYASGFRQIVSEIIVRGIPLTNIDIVSWPSTNESRGMMDAQIPHFLRHLATCFCNTLEGFSLHMDQHSPFDAELCFLFCHCKRLTDLSLYCKLQVSTVEELCSLQESGKLGLLSLSLSVNGLSPEELYKLSLIRRRLIQSITTRNSSNHVCISSDTTPY